MPREPRHHRRDLGQGRASEPATSRLMPPEQTFILALLREEARLVQGQAHQLAAGTICRSPDALSLSTTWPPISRSRPTPSTVIHIRRWPSPGRERTSRRS